MINETISQNSPSPAILIVWGVFYEHLNNQRYIF